MIILEVIHYHKLNQEHPEHLIGYKNFNKQIRKNSFNYLQHSNLLSICFNQESQ